MIFKDADMQKSIYLKEEKREEERGREKRRRKKRRKKGKERERERLDCLDWGYVVSQHNKKWL